MIKNILFAFSKSAKAAAYENFSDTKRELERLKALEDSRL